MTAGPNGDLWFGDNSLGDLSFSTVAGQITEFSAGLSGAPLGITAGPDGDLWLTEAGASKIARVPPGGTATEFSLPGGTAPVMITAGTEGDLWFTESGGEGAIGRITTSGVVTVFKSGLTPGSEPDGITVGPEGNLWFTEWASPGRIGRITPSGVITQFTTGLTANSHPEGITAGPDGNLWFTESANPGRIGRITPSGVVTEFTSGLTPNAGPRAITTGNDGNLYFTEPNSGKIGEITTSGAITERKPPTSGSVPQDIVTGPDGNLWFTESANPGRIAMMTVAPKVESPAASVVSERAATLEAIVGPNSQATTYSFEYGTTSEYGSQTSPTSAGSGATSATVSASVSGLRPSTLYHFRVVATNETGATYGSDSTFTTASLSSNGLGEVTIAPGEPAGFGAGSNPNSVPVAPPQLGKTALARPVSGTVLVRVSKTAPLRALNSNEAIPVGALVDATNGRLVVTTAVGHLGRSQAATVWGAAFVIEQRASGHGMTTFALSGESRAACARRARRPGRASAAHYKPRKRHNLWAEDHGGQFSTRGQDSVATVRGTYWGTIERCDGTLTVVRRGVVSVRVLRTHRTVLVRAGHSYLAKN
jgi:streptogramin lyase